jgi:hypothetical protein
MEAARDPVGSSAISNWTSTALESDMRRRGDAGFTEMMRMMRTDDERNPSVNETNSTDASSDGVGRSCGDDAASLSIRTTAAVNIFWCSRVKSLF